MDFRTTISLRPSAFEINLETQVLSIGSCFSNCMGIRLLENKFKVIANPFGTIFNPLSIFRLLSYAVTGSRPPEETYVSASDVWKNLDFHSEFSATDKNVLEEMISTAISNVGKEFAHLSYLLITPGTAMVYETKKANYLVANCHKLPQKNFTKELLSIEEISKSNHNIFEKISEVNPTATLINTVSPVRHVKDGFAENSLSKAHLLSAIHSFINLKSSIVNRKSFYFPSFEIMMDELRDYRFYSDDMLHPNKTAIEIIWQKFSAVWIASETNSLQKEIAQIQSGLLHKPFNPESAEHIRFLEKLQNKIAVVQERYPHIRF